MYGRVKRREPAFKFKLFSAKQKKVLYWWQEGSPYEDRDIILADGAIRSGKTIAMICSFLRWSQAHHQGQDFIMAGKSVGALKRNVIKPALQILSAWGWAYDYNRSENFITIGTNIYYLFGANNEASQDVIQGLTAAGAFADEAALFPQSFIDQMLGRCSVEGAKVFMNCNPEGPFHYVKTEFIDKAQEKRIYHLHFTLEDNLSLSESVKDRFRRMFAGVFYQRFILGLWVMAEGVIFDMFNQAEHAVKTEPRAYTRYHIACDYGTQNPTTFGLWGLYEGIWYKVRTYYYSGRDESKQKTDKEFADDLVEFIDELPIKSIIIDPSAASFKLEVKNRGYKTVNADNSVLDGIRNLATALTGGLIKYNDCNTETFKEYSSYVWDAKAGERGEDKPVEKNDHCLDSDRYFVQTVIFGNNKVKTIDKKLLGI